MLLKTELEYEQINEFFWSDSKVVLGYISNSAQRLLAKAIKSNLPTTTVAVSGLTTRTDNDNLAVKVNEVNSTLKRLCRQIDVNLLIIPILLQII